VVKISGAAESARKVLIQRHVGLTRVIVGGLARLLLDDGYIDAQREAVPVQRQAELAARSQILEARCSVRASGLELFFHHFLEVEPHSDGEFRLVGDDGLRADRYGAAGASRRDRHDDAGTITTLRPVGILSVAIDEDRLVEKVCVAVEEKVDPPDVRLNLSFLRLFESLVPK
jgi:hypothetical protein